MRLRKILLFFETTTPILPSKIGVAFLYYYVIMSHMLTTRKKLNVIKSAQIHDTDTGSPEVQISILSRRIDELANHLKTHKKDNHSRRGLIQMVSDRRKHLKYLQNNDTKRYKTITSTLGLKSN